MSQRARTSSLRAIALMLYAIAYLTPLFFVSLVQRHVKSTIAILSTPSLVKFPLPRSIALWHFKRLNLAL